jgi:DNA polymerase-3 subunit chi
MLDDLLWRFRYDSFIPHERYLFSGLEEVTSPILIGTAALPPHINTQVLINYNDQILEDFNRYERIIELVDQNKDTLEKSRKKFRQYCKFGYIPEVHKVDDVSI